MAGLWYRAGTISVTNGSKKITGFGTLWKTTVLKPDKGHPVHGPDGRIYELDYVESDTVMYIVTAYAGATATGQAYAIDIPRTSGIPAFSRDLSAFMGYHQTQMDGWQQLLTGTGDATLTAPDGTKLTLPTWDKVMNVGAGVVAQAKTEADRAKAEAANSAASAASAGNAVVAAALPLPDVWAPLSDSLRFITGYGREVKVGDDVVARMVNFSRSTTATYIGKDGALKTAGVNEPRFEKEGLLIEGASTNLRSQPLHLGSVVGANGESLNDTLGAINAAKYTITADAGLRLTFICQPASSTSLTFSIKIHQSSSVRSGILLVRDHTAGANLDIVNFNLDTDSDSATCKKFGQWNCYTVTTTRFTSGSVPWVYFGATGSNSPGQTIGKFLVIGDCQVEPLPFASSYIPTNGTAVTRSADVVNIPALGNMVPIGFSISAEFDTLRGSVSVLMESGCVVSMEQENKARMAIIRGKYASADADYGFSTHCGAFGQAGYVTAILKSFNVKDSKGIVAISEGGGLLKMRVNSSVTSVSSATATVAPLPNTIRVGAFGDAGSFPLFGHVRNLRIWHRTLTDAQLKAIA
ncbi:hypothetical protein [Aeromonas sp. s4]|uniref:phage head spike fiber domain-containing protein n=1 Tax=Aeromonas sp. s4 TaxID=3138486 RepID=UPI0034A56EFD